MSREEYQREVLEMKQHSESQQRKIEGLELNARRNRGTGRRTGGTSRLRGQSMATTRRPSRTRSHKRHGSESVASFTSTESTDFKHSGSMTSFCSDFNDSQEGEPGSAESTRIVGNARVSAPGALGTVGEDIHMMDNVNDFENDFDSPDGQMCSSCGNVYAGDSNFCRNCGKRREDDTGSAETDSLTEFPINSTPRRVRTGELDSKKNEDSLALKKANCLLECVACGAKSSSSQSFCGECGGKLPGREAAVATSVQTSPKAESPSAAVRRAIMAAGIEGVDPTAAEAFHSLATMSLHDGYQSESSGDESGNSDLSPGTIFRKQLECVAMGLVSLAYLLIRDPKLGTSRRSKMEQEKELLVELQSLRHWITNRMVPAGWDPDKITTIALRSVYPQEDEVQRHAPATAIETVAPKHPRPPATDDRTPRQGGKVHRPVSGVNRPQSVGGKKGAGSTLPPLKGVAAG